MYQAVTKVARRKEKTLRRDMRPRILKRDATCRLSAGDSPVDDEYLQMAHITPMSEFRARLGVLAGTIHSYREDNLVLLCGRCHAIQESFDRQSSQSITPVFKALLEEEFPGHAIHKVPKLKKHYGRIQALFAQLKEERGWTTVQDLARREGLEPDSGAPTGPTFAEIDMKALPAARPFSNPVLMDLCAVVEGVGGRVLRHGMAVDFISWYETQGTKEYGFSDRQAPTVLFQRPREESLIGKIQRAFAKKGHTAVLRQLKVSDNLYLMHAHRS